MGLGSSHIISIKQMTSTQTRKTLRDSALVRWSMLILIALTMFFAYMFVDVLSPLKTQLEQEVNWSGTVFGTYGGSEFFLNVFFGFLIFAGIILDKMGVRFTAILSGSVMVLGALIKVYALSPAFNHGGFGYDLLNSFAPNFPPSAKLACAGFAIFGSGCEMAGVTVSRAIVKWFSGKEMAMAMGIEMAVARLGVFAVFQTSPRIYEHYGSVQHPVIFVCILLVIGLLFYLIYGIFDKKLDSQMQTMQFEEEPPFKFSDLKMVFGSRVFWLVALLCVLYYSAIFPFQKFATNMLENTLKLSTTEASNIFSMFPVGAMVLTPLLGLYLDRKGKGATMLIVGAVLLFICHMIFAVYPFDDSRTSYVVAISAIVILGISFSLVPAALWPSVPKLIDSRVLGSAYSAIFFIQNIGLMVVPMIIGMVVDRTNVGVVEGHLNYTPAMLIFASFGVIAFLIGLVLKAYDRKKGYGLELPNIKK